MAAAIGSDNDVVSAIVTYHDGTQLVSQYAPYTLQVNGVTQPGGRARFPHAGARGAAREPGRPTLRPRGVGG